MARRRVRVMYILAKNEEITSLSQIFNFEDASTFATANPPYVPNPGITYRIVYDKTYSIGMSNPVEILVRLPRSIFYDGGSVQYAVSDQTQRNNYLYRVFLVQDAPIGATTFNLVGTVYPRWKYYDLGVSSAAVAGIEEQVKALTARVNAAES